jgi:hypothetical protein
MLTSAHGGQAASATSQVAPEPDSVTGTVPAGSDDACVAALRVYERLMARITWSEPDSGQGPAYESGRRAIISRSRIQPYRLLPDVSAATVALFEAIDAAPEDVLDDLVDSFAREFLRLIDRRRHPFGRIEIGRRSFDRAMQPAGMPDGRGLAARQGAAATR